MKEFEFSDCCYGMIREDCFHCRICFRRRSRVSDLLASGMLPVQAWHARSSILQHGVSTRSSIDSNLSMQISLIRQLSFDQRFTMHCRCWKHKHASQAEFNNCETGLYACNPPNTGPPSQMQSRSPEVIGHRMKLHHPVL